VLTTVRGCRDEGAENTFDFRHRASHCRQWANRSIQGDTVFETIVKSIRVIGPDRRWRWVVLTLMAVVQSMLEMLGALLVFVLLGMVADPEGKIGLPIVGDVRAVFGGLDDQTFLIVTLLALGAFFVTRAAFHVFVVYAQHRVGQNLGARVAVRLALGYLGMSYSTYVLRNTAELIRNADYAVDEVVSNALMPLIKVIADSFVALGLLTVMLIVSPLATGIAIVVVGGSQVLLLRVIQPRLKRHGHVVHQMGERTLDALQQALYGFRDIRLLGRERAFARRYQNYRERLARTYTMRGTVLALPPVLMETALVGFILIFFGVAVVTGMATEEVLAVLGVFAYAGLRLQPTLNRMISGLNEIRFATAAVEEVAEELDFVASHQPPPPQEGGLTWQTLSLRDVAFTYEGTDTEVLRDISLDIHRGETVGICGPTGGGKTTLLDLISGLLTPTEGRVLLDGQDLEDVVRAWQAELGVVSQMVFLTDDTVRRNIALGVPDEEIDGDAMARAVSLAQLDEFVATLPEGLETYVGDRGIRMSGGQRQRIAIARALYRRASFLIFDEGTSALDNATERHFMDALGRLRGGHTIVIVAHRLSTVEQCDRIIYLEQGRIIGVGTYSELLTTTPGFRELTGVAGEST
jgi:ATP-binding cassette, subfamily B, bacterial PglK